jgi:translocator protein
MDKYYQSLKKPSWTPAVSTIGTMWTILYPIIIAVNIYIISQITSGKLSWKVGLPFWLNLAFNIAFTPIQFGLRNNLLASVDIILILATIVWAMIAVWPHSRLATIAFVPYLVWVAIATVLQINIYLLNR